MHAPVLIAGAGDVGLRTARLLAARGHPVYALRRRPPADVDTPGITWVRGDLLDPASLHGLPAVGIMVFAATPAGRTEADYRAIFIDGMRNLMAALPAPPERTVFVSSSAVYGDAGGNEVDEDTPPAPKGFNGRILLEAEQRVLEAGVGGVVVRLAGLYGPGRTHLLERLREGLAVAPRGGQVYANRIHVDDAAAALALVATMKAPQPVYVGVDDTPLPIDELYRHLAALVNGPEPADGPGPAGVGNKRLSNARLRAAGFRCQWPDARHGYESLL